jgi:hypothetical protein
MRKWTRLGAAVSALVVTCATAAVAQTPEPPGNDDYLAAIPLNEEGTRLDRRTGREHFPDTTNATVQADMLNPPESGGPGEPTTCDGATVGKTVWYRFYPDVRGFMRIRAGGFDTFVAAMPFNSRTLLPNLDRRLCFNESSGTLEEVFVEVPAGGNFMLQIGGVNDAGGALEARFDFLADVDGDQVFDENDRCRTLPGPLPGGCPPRLNADSLIRALPTATGVRVLSLAVRAPRRSRVAVSCTRRACPSEVRRARSTVRLRRIRGRELPAGSKLVIRVTRRRAIGTYIAYRIQAGNFKKIERCLNPGSRRPRKRCG